MTERDRADYRVNRHVYRDHRHRHRCGVSAHMGAANKVMTIQSFMTSPDGVEQAARGKG
jgi:hypothetical protein